MTRPDSRAIARYLGGRSVPSEQRRIESWLDASVENRRTLDQLRRVWFLGDATGTRPTLSESETRDDWRALRATLYEGALPRTRRASDRPAVTLGARSAVRRTIFLTSAAVLLAAAAWFVSIQMRQSPEPVVAELREVATRPGQRARVPLGDGTFVRLNVASALRYPEEFTSATREVYLDGEAFFEVADDSARPFIVHAANAAVRVLGTAFNVRAYDEDRKVDVVVARGKVELQSETEPAAGVVLSPEEMGRMAGESLHRVGDKVDINRHLAWMEGRLVFEDTPLRDVAAELERWYTLEVRIENVAIEEWRLTASFKHESIDEILSVIAASTGIRYSRDRAEVTFFL